MTLSAWFKNGDHPNDGPRDREGLVVRYFRRPDVPGYRVCGRCLCEYKEHGWIDSGTGVSRTIGQDVCPGSLILDWPGGGYSVFLPDRENAQ